MAMKAFVLILQILKLSGYPSEFSGFNACYRVLKRSNPIKTNFFLLKYYNFIDTETCYLVVVSVNMNSLMAKNHRILEHVVWWGTISTSVNFGNPNFIVFELKMSGWLFKCRAYNLENELENPSFIYDDILNMRVITN
ncbi:hypothetical protein RF11_13252 [Thelohanellus kitauei]|uniref:Uncharacterized protein n=1 Tax=Thelohanellus kitauei TaxID=669202 RepID=A0A0C2IK81_THEKT|nr:hypothetical protein RF11_13252 [Thelohanellus kitauei]